MGLGAETYFEQYLRDRVVAARERLHELKARAQPTTSDDCDAWLLSRRQTILPLLASSAWRSPRRERQ